VEALNVNKSSANQRSPFMPVSGTGIEQCYIQLQKTVPVKIWQQTVWYMLQNLASNLWRQFLVPVSGASVRGF